MLMFGSHSFLPRWLFRPSRFCSCSDDYSVSRLLLRLFFTNNSVMCLLPAQVDKLVQLLESPIFLRLRLQLLDVDSPSYPALLKSLYGILMLLPQVRPQPPF